MRETNKNKPRIFARTHVHAVHTFRGARNTQTEQRWDSDWTETFNIDRHRNRENESATYRERAKIKR